ncbi:phage-associated protein [Streptococcus pneumoniae]|nr:phage-associated protein [Streptococcus pneumoniae]VNW22256.1 phage-associated protein [Streptococcus pneumoniae]VOB32117.1 phage-associated protein [Streptococcus pneumoniae]
MINKLSRYMESSGKTYQNHYVTILKWYEEDKDKLRQKGLNKKMNYDVGESLSPIIHPKSKNHPESLP